MAQNLNTSTTAAAKAVTLIELWLTIMRTAVNPGSIVLDCPWEDFDDEEGITPALIWKAWTNRWLVEELQPGTLDTWRTVRADDVGTWDSPAGFRCPASRYRLIISNPDHDTDGTQPMAAHVFVTGRQLETPRHWRTHGRGNTHEDGPRYWKFLDRIGYTVADLEEWIAQNMQERRHTQPGDSTSQRGSVAFRILQGVTAVALMLAASTLLWWGYDHLTGWPWAVCVTVSFAVLLAAIGIGTDSLDTPAPRHEAGRWKEER